MKAPIAPAVSRAALIPLIVLGMVVSGAVHSQEDRDFSQSNSVTLLLVEARRGQERPDRGLTHAYWERDGWTTTENRQGVACRCLSLTDQGYPKGYFYFAIDPAFKEQDVAKVRIDVDYFDGFDGQEGVFGVQVDTTRPEDGTGFSSQPLLPNVALKGSGKWLHAAFHIRNATFRNAQNARSDFRLWASPPELCVSRATVTLEPQKPPTAEPIRFDAAGTANLPEWNIQWDAGDKPSFSRADSKADDSRWLQIQAPGTPAAGSWRTSVWLEPGDYDFVGRVRTEGLAPDAEATSLTLRASGRGGARVVNEARDWTPLTYRFTMPTPGYIELVCDFRGVEGTASFDLDSLKLLRKTQKRR